MPYIHRKVGTKTCVYKKEDGSKVGCTSGSVKKYLAALHINEDVISGGLSDGKSISDLVVHHGKDSWASIQFESLEKKLKKELNKGIGVELEHTDDENIAREIAMDHLWEDPDYYSKLISMEENRKFIGDMLNEEIQKLLK